MSNDWEDRAVGVMDDLEDLQQDAPIDVSGFLQQAVGATNIALSKYRENRRGHEQD